MVGTGALVEVRKVEKLATYDYKLVGNNGSLPSKQTLLPYYKPGTIQESTVEDEHTPEDERENGHTMKPGLFRCPNELCSSRFIR